MGEPLSVYNQIYIEIYGQAGNGQLNIYLLLHLSSKSTKISKTISNIYFLAMHIEIYGKTEIAGLFRYGSIW